MDIVEYFCHGYTRLQFRSQHFLSERESGVSKHVPRVKYSLNISQDLRSASEEESLTPKIRTESFLNNIDILYATSSNYKVRICIGDVVTHGEEPLRLSD